jgi:hypothetical protein
MFESSAIAALPTTRQLRVLPTAGSSSVVLMNGYAAVYEPAVQASESFAGLSGAEKIGTVNATQV